MAGKPVHPYPTQKQARPRAEVSAAQVIGIVELPEFLGFVKGTVHMWGYRGHLPEPDYPSINGHKAWRRRTIVKWAAETGRLPRWLYPEGSEFVPDNGPQLRRTPARGSRRTTTKETT